MDEFSATSDTLDQTDEDILTYTVSDDALEDAAGIEMKPATLRGYTNPVYACGGCIDLRQLF